MKRIDLPPSVSNGGVSRREALRRAASAGALISLSPLAGFGVSTAEAAEEAVGKFPKHPQWKFVFVNHVTTNPFWVPLRYGAEDACALLGTTFQWTGSEKSIATEMVNAFNTAVSAKADGIAISLVDPSAFNDPVEKALAEGIPVVSYNADAKGNKRLCYIGQDLFLSGKGLGQRIVEAVGEGEVAGFIATPGQLNIQPRMDGAREEIKESGRISSSTRSPPGQALTKSCRGFRRIIRGIQTSRACTLWMQAAPKESGKRSCLETNRFCRFRSDQSLPEQMRRQG